MRDQTAAMYRVKNEERWIGRSLERTFEVARTVVLFDDGSTDATEAFALQSLGIGAVIEHQKWGGWIGKSRDGSQQLHFLHSPFTGEARPFARVQEARDKNVLWWHCQTHVPFEIMLSMDGDEVLTKQCIREWPRVIQALHDGYDIVHLNFLYIWDTENQIRNDAIYGATAEGLRRLNFPRVFSVKRVDEKHFVDMGLLWFGSKAGGQFHCGSLPRHNFRVRGDQEPKSVALPLNVAHYGYFDEALRTRKYEFYNRVDPGNRAEGEYLHIIGKPNVHAPGAVELVPYIDE